MVEHGNISETDLTAFEENAKEIICHLELEPDTAAALTDRDVTSRDAACSMCGNSAVWYTKEFQEDSPTTGKREEITRFWCGNCISDAFIDAWKARPSTPDAALEDVTPAKTSDNRQDGGLLTQDPKTIVFHLDLERESADVTGLLEYYDTRREDAVYRDSDQQAGTTLKFMICFASMTSTSLERMHSSVTTALTRRL